AKASRERTSIRFETATARKTPLQRFLSWSASDPRNRTISPLSKITFSKWTGNKINERNIGALRLAIQIDPTNATLTAHLGRLLGDDALTGRLDEDAARRARGETDFLTSRAQKLAPDNDEVKRLRDEVVRLLELKSD